MEHGTQTTNHVSFTTPLALLLLLAIPFIIWLGRPRPGIRGRWRDWVSVGMRVLIVLLLALALAGTQFVQANDTLAVVFLMDASDSVSSEQAANAEQFVRAAIETMEIDDQAAVILFGANALVERPMSSLAELAPVTTVPQRLQTDLAEAVRLGLALFPAGSARRIVILSDGAATIGNSDEAGKLAANAGVEISYVPLSRDNAGSEAWLTKVNAPTRISQGEIFRIDVTAESDTNMPATLRVLSGGTVVHEESVDLRRGVNNFSIRLQAGGQEFARYRVQLEPQQDTYYQNNELAAFTEITGPPRILIVANDGTVDDEGVPQPDESVQLQQALEAVSLQVDRITPANLPASLAQLSNYASIVLVNVNGKNLTPRKMDTLQSYVRDLGGGLVAVGGPQSYGMGGYFKTPLEETLPVEMQIKDQERFPAVSMVIVIDRSGSMGAQEGGVSKIQLAAEGAIRVVELLNDFDDITVIPVDTAPDQVIGPLPASDKPTAIMLIQDIGAGGGGIYVRAGLEAAAAALSQSSNQVKHIIVLADGADSEQKEGVPELLDGLTAEDVTISFVSIGDGADVPWLQQMAERGNGRFHFTDRAANLPQIFTQETTNIQRSYLVEERFFPNLHSDSLILSGIAAVPPLYGYVGTSPKDTAQVILTTHQEDPLLAAWQYGLGRAVAWTSDATGRWGQDWVQWEGFPAFWAQTVRWTVSQDRDSQIETAVTFDDENATLTVDARAADETFLNNLLLEANVVAPDGAVQNLMLPQVAPGRYVGDFTPQSDGAYFIRVAGTDPLDEEVSIGQTSGWVLGYSPEYQQFESNPGLLESLAERTGGQDLAGLGGVDEAAAAIFAHNLPTEPIAQPIWPWLVLAAVLLLPLDIAVRRLIITRRDWERAYAATFGRFVPQKATPTPRTEQVSRLFQAKQRAGMQKSEDDVEVGTAVPPPIQQEDTITEEKTSPTPPPAKPPQTPPTSGTLASRLLDKKRQQDQDG
ncbi:MAG: VWA domain-containing protein [Chloroflexi bacterium]|nr:VWA domain-containing protein [Chloroflexota bacterium]